MVAKRETATPPQIDPAALGALIPEPAEEGAMTMGSLGPEAPPLLRNELPQPPASQGHVQKARRVAAATSPVADTSPRKEVNKMLPSSVRVHIFRKKTEGPDTGKLSFLNEYSAQELAGCGTIEIFIKKYVVPEYGYGEFHVYYTDGVQKELQPRGTVAIDPPISAKENKMSDGGMSALLKEFIDYQKTRDAQVQAVTQQKSPVESMVETYMSKQLEKTISGNGQTPSNGESPMASMLMMMMMQQMNRPAVPSVDPTMVRLLEKLSERLDAMENEFRVSQAMTPPPPPPPSNDPSPIQLLLEGQRESNRLMLEAIKSSQRDPIRDLSDMAQLMAPRHNESLTSKDLIELMPKFKALMAPEGASDPFEKTIDNFRLFKMMQREFGESDRPQQQQGETAESFWSFAKEMIRSDVGKSIAAQIMSQTAGQDIASHSQKRALNERQRAADVARRRAEIAAQQRHQAEMRARQAAEAARQEAAKAAQQAEQQQTFVPDPALSQPTPSAAEQVAQAAPAASQPQPVAPIEKKLEEKPSESEQPSESESGEDGGEIQVPQGFIDVHLPNIHSAPNDAERIGAVISGFQILATSPDFRPVISKMFGLCKMNRRIEALDHLKEILEFFSENEVLDPKLVEVIVGDFDRHWKTIRMRLNFPDIPEVAPESPGEAQAG